MKTLLIGGCSFSQYNIDPWISWTNLLRNEYKDQINIINRAQSSFGQSLIIQSLMDELIERDFKVDYVIIQWSAVGRAYSTNQIDFVDKIMSQGEQYFAPCAEEYVINKKGYEGWVTDINNQIDEDFYTSSIDKMILFKYLLESKNIPYTMFWGWEQLSPEFYQKKKKWIDILYDQNFWRFNGQGGMLEWIVDKLGEKNSYAAPDDFHPSTQGHELFYNHIIKDILKPIL